MHEWHEYDNVTVAYYIDAMPKKMFKKVAGGSYLHLSKHKACF